MCFIVFALRAHPDYPLIVAANRDEFFAREATPAHQWDSGIIAGKDVEQGGTWLGVNQRGQFAAITNYRAPALYTHGKQTRGRLPVNFLLAETFTEQDVFSNRLREGFPHHNPFNLLYGNADSLRFGSNITANIVSVNAGIHALSNSSLNTPWPKVVRGKRAMSCWIESAGFDHTDALFELLASDRLSYEAELPNTGVAKGVEKNLSSIFVRGEHYGTRCSTLIMQNAANEMIFIERSFDQLGRVCGEIRFEFSVAPG